MPRLSTEDIHGFLILTTEKFEEIFADNKPEENVISVFELLSHGAEEGVCGFEPTEKKALQTAKDLFGVGGMEILLVPVDIQTQILDTMSYRFETQVIPVPVEDEVDPK